MAKTSGPLTGSALEAEQQKMKDAVFEVHAKWATIENYLALILDELIKTRYSGNEGLIIYYSVHAAETRMRVVSNVVMARIKRFEPTMKRNEAGELTGHPDSLKQIWLRFLSKADIARVIRNEVAHGEVIQFYAQKKDHMFVRLDAAMFNANRDGYDDPSGKPRGKTVRQVQADVRFLSAVKDVAWDVLKVFERVRHENLDRTPLEAIPELEAGLDALDRLQGGQMKPAPRKLPQS